jgi:hypothetical protein
VRRLAFLAATVLLALAAAGAARADGDPASDFLYLGTLYPSFTSPPSPADGDQLRGLLKATKAAGYPIKVALLADKQDLGQYPQLYTDPQRYARLLASELAIYKKLKAPVVVVTANGLGVAGNEPRNGKLVEVGDARAKQLLRGIVTPSEPKGDALAAAAMSAVQQLAKLDGKQLPAHIAPVGDATATTAAVPTADKSLSGWLVAGIVAAVFFGGWLTFEIVATLRERRRRSLDDGASETGDDEHGDDPRAEGDAAEQQG